MLLKGSYRGISKLLGFVVEVYKIVLFFIYIFFYLCVDFCNESRILSFWVDVLK